MIPFFITGLPRSRTAWLANWLTTDHSLVYHDVPMPVDLRGEWKHIGFSGPELAEEYECLSRLYPSAKWLVVLRPESEAKASFLKWSGDSLSVPEETFDQLWHERVKRLARVVASPNARMVEFNRLDEASEARKVWEYLMPELEFDASRWRVLNEFNVQQSLQKGLKRWQLAA